MKRISLLLLLVCVAGLVGCNKDPLEEQIDAINKYIDDKDLEGVKVTSSGLRYVVTEEGTGAYPEPLDKVTVHYEGTRLDGSKFDSSFDRGTPFKFTLGIGQVIAGWDEGIGLLNVGSKAILILPSNLAYGQNNSHQLSDQALVFRVELLEVEK